VLMLALVLVPVVVAVALLVPGRRVGLWGFRLGACTLAAALVALLAVAPSVLDGDVRSETIEWVPALGLDFAFRLDGFGWFMAVVVSAIGALVFAYSAVYFRDHHGHASRPDVGRIAGLLLAFAAAMLGLVLADGFFTLFCFWELTSVTSFLLIGIDDRSAKARSAAQRALLVTALGGLALLAGLVLLGLQSGVTTISALVADPPGGTVTTVALVLVLTGAFAKSAQFPLHFWLPGAMAAPTPVSAYLHSATMVKAGIVLIARLAPAFAPVGPWRPLVIAAGGLSLLLGGWRALRETPSWRSPTGRSANWACWCCCSGSAIPSSPSRVRRCCSPTRCSRRRCSSWSGSSTTQRTPATSGASRGSVGSCRAWR